MSTLDTNAIIYYLKNGVSVANKLEEILSENTTIYISSITELEL